MENKDKIYKRKQIIVNENFQFKLIVYFVLIAFISANITGSLVYLILEVDNNFIYTLLHKYFEVYFSNDLLVPIIIFSEFITIILVLLIAIIISHRIAGPIYRFITSTKKIEQGDLNFRIKLRKYDEFIELEESFNNMLDTLNNKIDIIKNKVNKIDNNTQQNELIKNLKEELEFFKIDKKNDN